MSIEAMKAVREGNAAMIVTFFSARLEECRIFFTENGVPFSEKTDGSVGGPSIILVSASQAAAWPQKQSSNVVLIFHGLYPLPGREQALAENFPSAKARLSCSSLADPLFTTFGMEKVATLMETLGMKDGECIEHRFVDKAIDSAREKLGGKVKNEIVTDSEEEWFRKNISK